MEYSAKLWSVCRFFLPYTVEEVEQSRNSVKAWLAKMGLLYSNRIVEALNNTMPCGDFKWNSQQLAYQVRALA